MIHVGVKRDALRFYEKVDSHSENPCWVWTGYVDSNGYGRFSYGGRKGGMVGAHRMAVFLHTGKWPAKGLDVDHLCRNKRCVRWQHLEVVTHQENNLRGLAGANGERERATTHCPSGHAYDEANTGFSVNPNGNPKRRCRECARLYSAAQRARKATT